MNGGMNGATENGAQYGANGDTIGEGQATVDWGSGWDAMLKRDEGMLQFLK